MADEIPAVTSSAEAPAKGVELVRDCMGCKWTKPLMDNKGVVMDWSKKVCIGSPPAVMQVMTQQGPAIQTLFPVVQGGMVCRVHKFRGED